NVSTHSLLGIDLNHVGDTRFFNLAGAQAAIAATLIACGASTIDQAIASCAALHPTGGATMDDFAVNALTATYDPGVGGCPAAGCAFPGINKTVSNLNFLEPIGRSVYNGMDLK